MKNYYVVLSLFGLFVLSSCQKDEFTPPTQFDSELTVEDDKSNLKSTFEQGTNCSEEMTDGHFVQSVIREFLNVQDGESINQEWVDELFSSLDEELNVESIQEDGRFDMESQGGTYVYMHDQQKWSKLSIPSDAVIITFPSTPNQTENNGKVSLKNYQETSVTIDGSEMWLPTAFNMKVEMDSEEVFRIDLNKVEYADNADFEIPVAIDVALFMSPFELTFKVDRNNDTNLNVDMDFKGGACEMGLDMDVELNNSDFESLDTNSIKEIAVTAHLNDLKIQSLSGIAELLSMEDPSDSEMNNLLDLDVLFNDAKIADLRFDDNGETVTLIYKDESEQNAEVYLNPFTSQLASMLEEFTGH